MIILNAGIPRSGTVLVNAMLRQLLLAEKVPVSVTNVSKSKLISVLKSLRRSGRERHRATLVHLHTWTAEATQLLSGSAWVTAFANYRDPRDVCVSLMRLHDHLLDEAAALTSISFDHFERFVSEIDPLIIPYELLVSSPKAHIFQIARHLGFWPGQQLVAEIERETSIEKHSQIMKQVQDRQLPKLITRENYRRTLFEDPHTMISDRHIQSGQSGRWKSELSPDDQARLTERFLPLLELYGYEVDP